MFSKKPNPLSLMQYENYSFGGLFDKISTNNNEIYQLNILNSLVVSKPSEKN